MKNLLDNFSLSMALLILVLPSLVLISCDKKEDDNEDIPIVPIPPPMLNISIEWSTDPDRFGDDNIQWSGKANITIQLGFDSEGAINNVIFPLTGTGSGTQYDCEVNVEAPYYIENLSTPPFIVRVTGGSYIQGNYAFTLTTDEANFSFDQVRNDEGHIIRFFNDPDELELVLGDIIFELLSIDNYVFFKDDNTILGTAYKVIAAFEPSS